MSDTTCTPPPVVAAADPSWQAVGNGVLDGEPRWLRLLAWTVDLPNRGLWWRRTGPGVAQ